MTFTSMSRHQISNVATSAKAGRTKKYQCRDIAATSEHRLSNQAISDSQCRDITTQCRDIKKGISIEVLNLQCRDITTAMLQHHIKAAKVET